MIFKSMFYIFLALVLISVIKCTNKTTNPLFQQPNNFDETPGALINVSFSGVIATVISETMNGSPLSSKTVQTMRTNFLNAPSIYWRKKAVAQIKYAHYQQINRFKRYPGMNKGQLVFPPEDVWTIAFDPTANGAVEFKRNGLSFIGVEYTFQSVLVARRGSILNSEPALATVGGIFNENFSLPLDPEFLIERTGYACIDESLLSLNSVDGYNSWMFYNDSCVANDECHKFHSSASSCRELLTGKNGIQDVTVKWERIKYEVTVADSYRVGNPAVVRDLAIAPVTDVRVVYKFFQSDDCIYKNNTCVDNYGWRRLLMFSVDALNIGLARFLNIARIGGDGDKSQLFVDNGIYSYDSCAQDNKYTFFGNYSFGKLKNSPIATCIKDSQRLQNHEYSPLATDYNNCQWQGISSGWAYTIPAGTPCQWIDITSIHDNKLRTLQVLLNTYGFICEGYPELSTWRPKYQILHDDVDMIYLTSNKTYQRPGCNYTTDYIDNNSESITVKARPVGASTTAKCSRGIKPFTEMRNCGWTLLKNAMACVPGKLVNLMLTLTDSSSSSASTVIRICETSQVLGYVSTRCEYLDAITHGLILPKKQTILQFQCPLRKSSEEKGGFFSVLAAKYASFEDLTNIVPSVKITML